MVYNVLNAHCVATTGHTFDQAVHNVDDDAHRAQPRSNLFREAQFSPDGTTIVTQNEDQHLRTFILPSDLLDDKPAPSNLREYASFAPPSNIQAYAMYPHFNLQDPSTTLVLHSSTEHPLALRNTLDYSTPAATYNLISPTTERHLTTHSLAFTNNGTHFVAGGHNSLSTFDLTHAYSGPISTHKLVPGKKARKLYAQPSLGCRGIVSALALNLDSGLLAAGTTEREIGLYASQGVGECTVSFSVAAPPSERGVVTGTGITHLRWSPCGRYLLAAERQSDGVQVWDVRNMVHRIAWLKGRKAETNQKLGVEIVPTAEGWEVWGGGTDGSVRMWRNPGEKEGYQGPDAEMKLHDDPVSSAIWHPGGAVLATCSGRRSQGRDHSAGAHDDDTIDPTGGSPSTQAREHGTNPDNRLAVWTVT